MKVDDFYFELPQELIAQTPLENRDESRLLQLNRQTGDVQHRVFADILDIIHKGDTIVLNDTRVLPARLLGIKQDTGAKVEVLLLKQVATDVWETLVKPGKKVHIGTVLQFGEGLLRAVCVGRTDAGGRVFRFTYEGVFQEVLAELGEMPLPPYIKEKLSDQERYQTVYAKHVGSAAAPTAGLHFTQAMLDKVKEKGVHIVCITLHVGLGTFRPVQVEDVEDHHMHAEFYAMDALNARILEQARVEGRRIIAVGTTSVRTLETIMRDYGQFQACSGWTDIFMYPGFQFQAVNGIITNFHLPGSTLMMLVSAFSGREHIMKAYHEAIEKRYRFFSFGDAMIMI